MLRTKEKKPKLKREKRRKKGRAADMENAVENTVDTVENQQAGVEPEEQEIRKEPFLKRLLFGEPKPDLSELESGSTTILDILSPTTVDTKSRDYIIVDGICHAYL